MYRLINFCRNSLQTLEKITRCFERLEKSYSDLLKRTQDRDKKAS